MSMRDTQRCSGERFVGSQPRLAHLQVLLIALAFAKSHLPTATASVSPARDLSKHYPANLAHLHGLTNFQAPAGIPDYTF